MIFFAILFSLLSIESTYAQKIDLFFNNKELISRELKTDEKEAALLWAAAQHLPDDEVKMQVQQIFQSSFDNLNKTAGVCDLNFPIILKAEGRKAGLIKSENDFDHFIVYLRASNLIDDIFYKIIKDSTTVVRSIQKKGSEAPVSTPLNLYTRKNNDIDIEKLYREFKTNPNEIDSCSNHAFFRIVRSITYKNESDLNRQLKRLNFIALRNGSIDLYTFNKLEVLREEEVLSWPIGLSDYISTVTKVKDKMTKEAEKETTSQFTTEYVSRRQKLTQRDRLYSMYSPTQIILLSEIIQRMARRLDARQVDLNFQLTDDPNGERDIYVLSPMEKYRITINMLKKEMAEAMRSENFAGTPVEYEDLIAASFETGYLKSEELEHVIKFEEFWNPREQKWKTYANFAFSLVGTASFYLPPPWNIVGAIGLVLTQSKTINKKKDAAPDESWNSII